MEQNIYTYILQFAEIFQSVDDKMKSCFIILFAFILTSYFHFGIALRCQSINQQIDNRFEKILKTCRKRNVENNSYDNDSNDSSNESNESSDSSSDSNEDDFNKKFFAKNNSRFYTNEFLNEQNDRNNRAGQSTRNANSQSSYHFNNGNERSRNVDYYDTSDWGNVRNSASNRNYQDNRNQKQNNSCISQCFLNELNAVDQRGFPVQESMIRVMTERIYDLELRDYIEESIIQCFQFLHSVNRMEKCEYSQNLITCLIGKGKEQCDDWNI